jgi:lincosamide nucleotidyltransferase A/C/D/E
MIPIRDEREEKSWLMKIDIWLGQKHRLFRSPALRGALRALYHVLAYTPVAPMLRLPALERLHRRVTATSVSAASVIEITQLLAASGVNTWLAGGWACDALLGEQTREHGDLDLIIGIEDVDRACKALERRRFVLRDRFSSSVWTTVLELLDRHRARQVGLHFVDCTRTTNGSGWQASVHAVMLVGDLVSDEVVTTGTIAGHEVPCLSAPALLALHTGYEPDETDRRDVQAICRRFSLPVPPAYQGAGDAR